MSPSRAPGLTVSNAAPHGLVAGRRQAARQHGGVADEVHAAGVAVKAVADHGDVDIDDVAALQALIPGMPWHTTWFTEVQMVLGKPR